MNTFKRYIDLIPITIIFLMALVCIIFDIFKLHRLDLLPATFPLLILDILALRTVLKRAAIQKRMEQ